MTGGRLTRAEERVLRKAIGKGVRRAGGYGHAEPGDWRKPGRDRPRLIDRCIARGLLSPTDFFNLYALTPAGRDRLDMLDARRAGRE